VGVVEEEGSRGTVLVLQVSLLLLRCRGELLSDEVGIQISRLWILFLIEVVAVCF